jgi:hypothetical protein
MLTAELSGDLENFCLQERLLNIHIKKKFVTSLEDCQASKSKRMFCNKLRRLQNIQIEANILQQAYCAWRSLQ